MNSDKFIVPAILLMFSALVIWASSQLDTSPPMIVGHGMQARAFPIFLMVLNILLVVALIWQQRRLPPSDRKLEPFATWGSILLLGVFYFLATHTDLFIGIAVVMFFMSLLWGQRNLLTALLVSLLTPAAIFLLFDKVLRIRFPRGILTNWYYG